MPQSALQYSTIIKHANREVLVFQRIKRQTEMTA